MIMQATKNRKKGAFLVKNLDILNKYLLVVKKSLVTNLSVRIKVSSINETNTRSKILQ